MYHSISGIHAVVVQVPLLGGLLIIVLCTLLLKLTQSIRGYKRNPSRLPLPPGPKGYPVIGNLLEMPTVYQWRTYVQWGNTYGNVFLLDVLGQRILVLNSLERVQDLLEKRSSNYSDRPRMPMLLELMDNTFNIGFLPYGKWWRRNRRTFAQRFNADAVKKYHPVQAKEARAFLVRLLQSPEAFVSHIKENLASSIMKVAYGIDIQGFEDPYIRNVEESMKGLVAAAVPGAFLVDLIPILKYLPSWLPGAGFRRKAAYWARVNKDVMDLPFNHVVQEMNKGIAAPSIAASLISALPKGNANEVFEETRIAKNVTAVAYEAAADATRSVLQTFFLAMSLYPEAQKKAQAELDLVAGNDRLPGFNDRPNLPYLNALIKETLRWQPATPLAFPHMSTDDDVYEGYFIPKGTLVIGNAWAILHDEKAFADPERYEPERFLKGGQLDQTVRQPEICAFGFGRRICPGRYFADNTMYLLIASTLHTFNITPGLDEMGDPTPISPKMTPGVLSYPEPFQVEIKPRSPSAEALIRQFALVDI